MTPVATEKTTDSGLTRNVTTCVAITQRVGVTPYEPTNVIHSRHITSGLHGIHRVQPGIRGTRTFIFTNKAANFFRSGNVAFSRRFSYSPLIEPQEPAN